MKRKKNRRLAAVLLALSIIITDFYGSSSFIYAAQKNSESEKAIEVMNSKKTDATPDDGQEAEESEVEESEAVKAFARLIAEYDMYGMLTGGTSFPIRKEAAGNAEIVCTLPSGYQIKLTSVVMADDGLWFGIEFAVNDVVYSGYIEDDYVISQDSRLEEWKSEYIKIRTFSMFSRAASAAGKTDLSSFPQSYQSYIKKLIAAHPNWTFVPMNTGLSWSEVLENEMVNGRNLVENYFGPSWKSTAPEDYNASTGKYVIKNGTTWVQASEMAIKYYLDPRNFLNEESVFQFEQLTYNSAYHTETGVEKILSGTFMSKKKLEDGSGGGVTYAKAFMKIGKKLKVSPYFLASRVRQEQGVKGTSPLISGKYPGYEGYYNYFNREATGIGLDVITNGLAGAKAKGWNTRYKALEGGASSIAADYISKGQDTFYLQKFDVDSSYNGLYWHQYMQNLLAADSEGKSVRNSYYLMGVLNNSFVFKVPVYTDMPASSCPKPSDQLSKPSLKVTKSSDTSVKLSWKAIAGATGYQVYRKIGENGNYKRIKTIKSQTTISYTDKKAVPGQIYYYKVRAYAKVNESNQYSSYSAVKNFDNSIVKTSWKKCSATDYTTVALKWSKKSVSGYRIYRKTDSGKYKAIKTINKNSTVTYEDTGVLPGHTYSYRIKTYKTVNGKKYYSGYSKTKTVTIQMQTARLKKAVTQKRSVALTWKSDTKASGYYIYRASSKKGKYTRVATIRSKKKTSWTDSSVKKGETYYYKMRSYVKSKTGKASSKYSRILMVDTKI